MSGKRPDIHKIAKEIAAAIEFDESLLQGKSPSPARDIQYIWGHRIKEQLMKRKISLQEIAKDGPEHLLVYRAVAAIADAIADNISKHAV